METKNQMETAQLAITAQAMPAAQHPQMASLVMNVLLVTIVQLALPILFSVLPEHTLIQS